jgi:Domain of unknown function (DUF4124)
MDVKTQMKKHLVMIAALAFSAAASAQMYKWVEKDGKVRYGDTPPAGADATPMKAPSAGTAPAPAAPEGKKEQPLSPEAAFRKRQLERDEQEQKAAKERELGEQKRANCERSQASLRQLQSGQRITSVNASGERVYIDDDQRTREIDRAQKAVSEWCK